MYPLFQFVIDVFSCCAVAVPRIKVKPPQAIWANHLDGLTVVPRTNQHTPLSCTAQCLSPLDTLSSGPQPVSTPSFPSSLLFPMHIRNPNQQRPFHGNLTLSASHPRIPYPHLVSTPSLATSLLLPTHIRNPNRQRLFHSNLTLSASHPQIPYPHLVSTPSLTTSLFLPTHIRNSNWQCLFHDKLTSVSWQADPFYNHEHISRLCARLTPSHNASHPRIPYPYLVSTPSLTTSLLLPTHIRNSNWQGLFHGKLTPSMATSTYHAYAPGSSPTYSLARSYRHPRLAPWSSFRTLSRLSSTALHYTPRLPRQHSTLHQPPLSEPFPPTNSDTSGDKCEGLSTTGGGDAEVLRTLASAYVLRPCDTCVLLFRRT